MSHLFCFGLGYSADVLARRLLSRGWTITGTATRRSGAKDLRHRGYRGVLFDGNEASAEARDALQRATHLMISIPPGEQGDPALQLHGDDIAASPTLGWIGYFSTVGVYGDTGGDWVNEETLPAPGSPRATRRLEAEQSWQALAAEAGKSAAIFRLPAIYGPGRSAIDDLLAGEARRIAKPGQVFNRIHVDDIATAVEAAILKQATGIYNVSDDEPAPPQDVVVYAAELLGVPAPPEVDFDSAELSAMARSFYSENRRVANGQMKSKLGVKLAFPTYRDGLKAIAKSL